MEKHKIPIKIAFTGAHGIGKTTLSNQIKTELERINIRSVVLETPRYICTLANDNEFLRRGHNTQLKQSLILFGQVVDEYKSTLNHGIDVQICDRTIIDHWSYTMTLFKKEFQSEGIDKLFEHFILEHYKSYDFVYYYPIERTPVDDGIRESDAEFQKIIDENIFSLLSKYNLPHKKISSKSKGYVSSIINDILTLLNTDIPINIYHEKI